MSVWSVHRWAGGVGVGGGADVNGKPLNYMRQLFLYDIKYVPSMI